MTKYIAATSANLILDEAALDIIWGMGDSPEEAIADAESYVDADAGYEFDTLPASERLALHVDNYGADAKLSWTRRNGDGVADLLDDEEY